MKKIAVSLVLAASLTAQDITDISAYSAAPGPAAPAPDNLPAPGVIAQEIVEDLQAALEQFRLIAADMTEGVIE